MMGDNGFQMGEYGLEGKWYGYEESIRVPFFICDPRLPDKIRQIRPRQIVLNIDIAPTILSMAGVPVPQEMRGVNLINLLENKIPERKNFFYQHYFLGSPGIPKLKGVVTKNFKYIEHNFEELYDIRHDPHETINLVNNPKCKMKLQELQDKYEELKKMVL